MKEESYNIAKIREIEKQEGIKKVIHRHWFNIAQQFLAIFLFSLLAMAILAYLPKYVPLLQEGNYRNVFIFAENIVMIFIWIFGFFIWIDYYFDIWVITSERIINIEQKGLFMRCLSELKLDKIQDVTVEVTGMIPTVLNFGDIYIQTAGETERFVFRQVHDPYGLKDMIMSMQKRVIAEETNELGEVIRKEIHKEIA